MKKENNIFNPKAKVNYLFAGKVYCGICGAKYNGTVIGKNKIPYYECYNHKKDPKCISKKICKDLLENNVISRLEKLLLSDYANDIILNVMQKIIDNSNINFYNFNYDKYNKSLKDLDLRLSRAKDAYLDGIMSLEEYKVIKNELALKRSDIKEPPTQINNFDVTESNNFIERLKVQMKEDEDVLYSIIDKIIVYEDSIKVFILNSYLNINQEIKEDDEINSLPINEIIDKDNCGGGEGYRTLVLT